MACYAPRVAWRTQSGGIVMGLDPPRNYKQYLQVPCTKCAGCLRQHAREWAFRCKLELKEHTCAAFTTLTYSDEKLPITLAKRHLQLWLKRLRKATGPTRPIRFFASGEYGTTTHRPHYHAILFNLSREHEEIIERTWGLGLTRTYNATPETIGYVAGYTDKKLGDFKASEEERLDPETGEIYNWQPPFILMSRGGRTGGSSGAPEPRRLLSATAEKLQQAASRPYNQGGLGARARQYVQAWRNFAIDDGYKISVPRYLHEAWKAQATPEEIIQQQEEKAKHANYRTEEQIAADWAIAETKHQNQKRKRKKL